MGHCVESAVTPTFLPSTGTTRGLEGYGMTKVTKLVSPEPKGPGVEIQVPQDKTVPKFSNLIQVTNTGEEFELTFTYVLHQEPGDVKPAICIERIVLTPGHAKRLKKTLADNIKNYEAAYGSINLPAAPEETKIGFKKE